LHKHLSRKWGLHKRILNLEAHELLHWSFLDYTTAHFVPQIWFVIMLYIFNNLYYLRLKVVWSFWVYYGFDLNK
jgi:hypothetical protein